MFETHIYTDKFFNFVIRLTKMMDIYELDMDEIVDPDHAEKSEKQKNLYRILIDMLSQFIIKIVAKAYDNEVSHIMREPVTKIFRKSQILQYY